MKNSQRPAPPFVVKCAYTVEGAGPTIVMVHGIGSHRQGWSSIVESLKTDFRCVTFDLRGHGVSPATAENFGMEDLVADLEALCRRLQLDRFHLMGHSLGAMVAASYTRLFTHRVQSLALFSTAAFRSADEKANIRVLVDDIRRNGLAASLDRLVHRWYTDRFIETAPEFIARRKDHLLRMDQQVLLNVFEIYAEYEMGPWLHEISVPTLIVTGEDDPGCNPRLNQLIKNAMPNAQLVILQGLKHSILVEGADVLAGAIRRFLTSDAVGRLQTSAQ
ncbi:MAG TPA: alpha/beta hydrolase [Aestuariivirgaceae bacterium]|jgi:pimeloyl-ACP methyl ester carboxylesterase